jgi:hypothetical protein
MLTRAWTELKPHAIQSKLWRSQSRFAAVAAGRGSGKTELARRRAIRMLPLKKSWPDPIYFYALPTRNQAKRVAWNHLKSLVPSSWLYKKNGISESDMTITTEFGSKLYLVGMDKPQRIEGNQWDGGIIDESCDQKPGHFTRSIVPALSHRFGWCWRIGVPKRQGPGASEFKSYFAKGEEGYDGIESYTWPSSDILSAEQLKWALENLDPKDFNEQYNAKWETNSGNIFYAFTDANVDAEVSYDPDLRIIVSSDFNVDPMCWVLCHEYANELHVFDELHLRNSHTQMALDNLAIRYGRHQSGWDFMGDASSKARKTAATFTDYALIKNDKRFVDKRMQYSKSNPLTRIRFAETNALLMNAMGEPRCFINPKCKYLIADLIARAYKMGTNEADDYGDIGHMTDALGYVIHRRFPIKMLNESKGEVFIG